MVKPKSTPKPLQATVTWAPFGIGLFSTAGLALQQEVIPSLILHRWGS